ncbi:hypothetical protein THRCLA_01317 [Thraustotheca clavata]|uniref:Uncharacterized protein n=1 Tax=Thraustotheca clavata TaxID=74557 RepID=A0A1W0A8M6_9STRA|nr:hypothetical protein THRCLA_01317 [Thraustotheca clavata]
MSTSVQWMYTVKQVESANKLYAFRLTTPQDSWTVLISPSDLRNFRQTLDTLYRNEVLNGNHTSFWGRQLRNLLKLPFPLFEWSPWLPSKMTQVIQSLLLFYDSAVQDTSSSFLLYVLKGLLRVFLGMPCTTSPSFDVSRQMELCLPTNAHPFSGKKKAFINKKEAQHFHVVHRSQRDPLINDPTASKYVLLSTTKEIDGTQPIYESDDDDLPDLVESNAPKQVKFGNVVAKDLVNELGMVNDGYDYSKHMKEIGRGHFYSAGGNFDEGASLLSKRVVLPDEVLASHTSEAERMLEAITITEDVMDEDLREALTNEEAFEELNDDFVIQAAEENEDDKNGNDGFDYDAHIAKLMAAADGIPKYAGHFSEDEEEFDEDDEEFSDEDGFYGESKDDAQRVLDEAFEKMLEEEYDDDMVGELDEEETRGKLVLEGDLLNSIVEDFVHIQQEVMDSEGRIGNPLRTGNHLKEVFAEIEAENAQYESEEEMVEMANMDDVAELNPYLAPRVDDQWDCETIVSTYSNLDNHPTLLREPREKKSKKKNPNHIILSSKTGMPLNITPISEEVESQDDAVINVGSVAPQLIRNRRETKEEKKERKMLAKNHKNERRTEKKETKMVFKDEKIRQLNQHGPRAGSVSFFKY